jgi:hypothetical protein
MKCDRCGNHAYFVAKKDSQELFFCRRDYLKNQHALREWATFIDGREDMTLVEHIENNN